MKNKLKTLGLVGLLASCEVPDISLDLAEPTPDTNKVYLENDTIIKEKDTLIYVPDTSFIPVDSSKVDTIIKQIPKDTIKQDTFVYKPKIHDENVFIDFETRNYHFGDLFGCSIKISNLSNETIKIKNSASNHSISYILFNEGKEIFRDNLDDSFTIELGEKGYFGINKRENRIDLTLCGGKAKFDKNFNVPYPLEFKLTKESVNRYFETSGKHNLELFLRYEINGKSIENKFYSEKFEVLK